METSTKGFNSLWQFFGLSALSVLIPKKPTREHAQYEVSVILLIYLRKNQVQGYVCKGFVRSFRYLGMEIK
jgi:hypothetical protein